MKLEGLYSVIITPFDGQGQLDQEGLRFNLRYQLKGGVNGIVILGTTGEAPTLTHEEKRQVIEIAVEEVKGKATLIVGTGSYSTECTIAATREAKEMGADMAMIITPYYNKPTQEGLYRHFAAICEAVHFPIVIYNAESRTAQNLKTATLKRLLSFPSLVGVKDCSANMTQFNAVLEAAQQIRPDFAVMSGDDAYMLPLVALGGRGIFSVVSNLIPDLMQNFVQAALKGDFVQARQWHFKLLPLFDAAFIETNPIPIKAAMELCGMPSGKCRLPLCDLNSENYQKLKQVIEKFHGQKKSTCC